MTNVKFDAVNQVGYVLDGEGDFDESAHPRDEKGQFTVVATGNTYASKDDLKKAGYKYHPDLKVWHRQVSLTNKEYEQAHVKASSLNEGTPEHAAQKELRARITGGIYHKGLQLTLRNNPDLHGSSSKSKVIHTGSNFAEKEKASIERSRAAEPDRTERNRAMHEALGHSGYTHIPGSAPDDLT